MSLRWRGHAGQNHEKVVLLYGQNLSIFGSSNWTTASATSQAEHNYFTTKNAIFQWFASQFDRMWRNTNPMNAAETAPFVPLPPDQPAYRSPANGSVTAGSSVTLTWYAGRWAHNYDIYVGASPSPPLVATNVNLGPSSTSTTFQRFTVSNLSPGTTYYWKVVSKTMANMTATGSVWTFVTPESGGGPLPGGWNDTDVGSVGVAGVTSYSGSAFAVSGSGGDIWGTADAFHYAWQSMNGDGQLLARVVSLSNVNSWTKAGVMVRGSLSASSPYALMLISAARGAAFQYRTSAGASAASVAGPAAGAPYWVKIVRAGNTITGYTSANGSAWATTGSATIAMGSTVHIGLAVSSHDNSRLATGTFDHVTR